MKLKQLTLIIITLILLPVLIFTVFEFNELSETEVLISGVYERQLDAVLFSVNQYILDLMQGWTIRSQKAFLSDYSADSKDISDFFDNNYSTKAFFTVDTNLSTSSLNIWVALDTKPEDFQFVSSYLNQHEGEFNRLLEQYQLGYAKIDPILPKDKSSLPSQVRLFSFVIDLGGGQYQLGGFIINPVEFMERYLRPKISNIAGDRFVLALHHDDIRQPLFTTAGLEQSQITITKKLWMFPDYSLGIGLQGTSVESLARERSIRSLILVMALDIVLLLAVWFLYRNLRREYELARLKTDFVSSVSHELRTPLALIRLFAETMELGRVKSKAKMQEYVTIIRRESERLSQIINKILDFSKIDARKKQYQMVEIDLNRIVSETLDFYKFHIENNGFKLGIELSPADLQINADKEAVTEALINLLDNAIKYSEEEKSINVRTGESDGHRLLEVSDHGLGIASDEHNKIFEKFYRIQNDNTIGKPGSGLGLTLVKYIMDAHNGQIDMSSTPGTGSSFTLRFPKYQ